MEIPRLYENSLTKQQIAHSLGQTDADTSAEHITQKMGVSEETFYRDSNNLAGMGLAELRRVKHFEDKNRELKRFVAHPAGVLTIVHAFTR